MSRNIVRYENLKQDIITTISSSQPNCNLVTPELIAQVVAQYWYKFKPTKYSAYKGGLSGLIREIVIYFNGGVWHSDLIYEAQRILKSVEFALARRWG